MSAIDQGDVVLSIDSRGIATIEFSHPNTTNSLSFTIPYPAKYESLFERENRRWEKFNS